jgi:hypothetical protein
VDLLPLPQADKSQVFQSGDVENKRSKEQGLRLWLRES